MGTAPWQEAAFSYSDGQSAAVVLRSLLTNLPGIACVQFAEERPGVPRFPSSPPYAGFLFAKLKIN